MFENESPKSFFRKMLPKIAKAAVKGVIYAILLYVVPVFILSQLSQFAPQLFAHYSQLLGVFVAVIIFFAVASELTAGTIYQHAFNVGRAIIFLVFFVLALDGGIMQFDALGMHVWTDVRVYLMMLITIDLLGLAKNILEAVNFLNAKAEQQLPTPKPTG